MSQLCDLCLFFVEVAEFFGECDGHTSLFVPFPGNLNGCLQRVSSRLLKAVEYLTRFLDRGKLIADVVLCNRESFATSLKLFAPLVRLVIVFIPLG